MKLRNSKVENKIKLYKATCHPNMIWHTNLDFRRFDFKRITTSYKDVRVISTNNGRSCSRCTVTIAFPFYWLLMQINLLSSVRFIKPIKSRSNRLIIRNSKCVSEFAPNETLMRKIWLFLSLMKKS